MDFFLGGVVGGDERHADKIAGENDQVRLEGVHGVDTDFDGFP